MVIIAAEEHTAPYRIVGRSDDTGKYKLDKQGETEFSGWELHATLLMVDRSNHGLSVWTSPCR